MSVTEFLPVSDAELDTLGGRISRARDSSGLTVTEASRHLGVKVATWQAWESDRSEPRSNRLAMAAGLLGVSPTWLLTGHGEGPNALSGGQIAYLKQEIVNIAAGMGELQDRLNVVISQLDDLQASEQEHNA
ncbi:MAG: helix-turn-helix domain-containing protein [Pseudomonadota bacterium]